MSRPTKRQRRFELTLDHDLFEWFEADAKKRKETMAVTVRRILVEYQEAVIEGEAEAAAAAPKADEPFGTLASRPGPDVFLSKPRSWSLTLPRLDPDEEDPD